MSSSFSGMGFHAILPVWIAFAISAALTPLFIPFLKRLKLGQFVRDDGPQTHLKKSGTPTMGGVILLIAIAATSLLFLREGREVAPILLVTLGFGLIGFLDDFIKVAMRRSLGLRPWQKMLAQIVVTGAFAWYLLERMGIGTEVLLPFTGGRTWDLGILYVPFLFFVVLGTVNGANFTDGLDGLASSVTTLIAAFFLVVCLMRGSAGYAVSGAVVGSLLGFLLFNAYPAKVFMGDTGSLALGGFVAATACVLRMPLFIVMVGLVYLVEILSVILQVTYFKWTKGKRIFKMAPIHHHFELCGWSETRVVTVFSVVTALLCSVALAAF